MTIINLDEICETSEMAKAACAYDHPGCRGGYKASKKRSYEFAEPIKVILQSVRPNVGRACNWSPYDSSQEFTLDPLAGHVHIKGACSPCHIRQVIRTCPNVYLITIVPTMVRSTDSVTDELGQLGIGLATLRLRGN